VWWPQVHKYVYTLCPYIGSYIDSFLSSAWIGHKIQFRTSSLMRRLIVWLGKFQFWGLYSSIAIEANLQLVWILVPFSTSVVKS
jgi:hypothetical protein